MTCPECQYGLVHWHCAVCGAARQEPSECSRHRRPRDAWYGIALLVLGVLGWAAVFHLLVL